MIVSKKKIVAVAMSGGVDSSVAAKLLVEQGYHVVGITLDFKPSKNDPTIKWYCGTGGIEQAQEVATKLGIEHHIVSCQAQFENKVLWPSWQEYSNGRTPNPCVLCNKFLKFGVLWELASKLGAEKIATGHYARIARTEKNDSLALLRGLDPNKDQSYFLFALSNEQLGRAIFPLGEMNKDDVRKMAKEFGFVSSKSQESQDACFGCEDGGFAEGLRRKFKAELLVGNIIDPSGEVLGKHQGIHRVTIGQRKGLRVAIGRRAYVTEIDSKNNTVVLSDNDNDIFSNTLEASQMVWSEGWLSYLAESQKNDSPIACLAQIRYRHRAVEATAQPIDNSQALVKFEVMQRAITPGQAVVLYDGQEVIGGGWIS